MRTHSSMDKLFADAGKFLSDNAFAVALVFLFFAVIASMRTLIRHSLGQRTISVVEYTELENMTASPSQAFCDEHDSLCLSRGARSVRASG